MKPRLFFLPSVFVLSFAAGEPSAAQTWNGGGADDLWGSGANWGGTAPVPGSATDLTFSGTSRLTPFNNYTAWDDFRNIVFGAGAGSFNITGSAVDLFGKIENNSSNLQTFGLEFSFNGGNSEINPVDGDLLINGANIFNNGNTINVWGDNGHTVTLDSVIQGTGGLTLQQNSTAILARNNSYSGATTINAGVLQIGNGGADGNFGSGSMTIGGSGTLAFNRTGSFNLGAITTSSGAKVRVELGTVVGTAATSFGSLATGNLVEVQSGGAIDLNGVNRSGNRMDLSIAGSGVGGTGALRNTVADTFSNAGVLNLTLTGNATIGGTNRFDIGRVGSDTGTITGNGFTLTKEGTNSIAMRGDASGSAIHIIANAGRIWAEDTNLAFGGAAGSITINSGARVGTYGTRSIATPVTINAGGILHNEGGGTGTWSGTITGGSGIFIESGSQMILSGAFSSTGNVTKSGASGLDFTHSASIAGTFTNQAGTTRFQTGSNALGGSLVIAGGELGIENTVANTFSTINLNGGTLRIKSNNDALGTATLAVGANAVFASQSGSSPLTFTNNASIAGTSTLSIDAGYAAITWNGNITGTGTKVGTSSTGTLTLGGTVNMGSNTVGTVSVDSGATMVLPASATVTAGTVSNTSTGVLNINGATVNASTLRLNGNGTININSGIVTAATVALNNQTGNLNIAGGTLNAEYINIGDGGSTSGRVTQTGGTVNVTGTNGMRIGHWDNGANAASVYNISGGILDASARQIAVGWDGGGTLNVSGTATVRANRLYVDANGADKPGVVNLQTGGRIEIGSGGTTNDGTTGSQINLSGGTMAGTATATWGSRMDANTSTASTVEIGTGFTVTQSGILQGSGNITKTGAGILALSNASNTFSGKYTVTAGTLSVGADAHLGAVPGATVADSITLNSATLRLTGSMTLNANRGITLSGGSTLNTASVGSSNTATVASVIAGSGGLVLAANGDTSATGGNVGGSLRLSGSNTFTGDVRITSGIVDADSNFGNASNTIILDGGGLVDKNLNVNFTRNIQVGAGGGVLRAYGGVTNGIIAGNVSNATGVSSATLRHTDGGTLKLAGDGSGFTGTFNNQRGSLQITANNANWANTDFVQDTNGSTITFNGGGTASIRSLSSTRDVFVQNGMTLKIGSGGITMSTNGHWWQTNSGTVGNLTSSTGTLTVTNGASSGNLTTTDQQIRLKIVDDGANPVALVKNNNNSLALNQANTFTGGTTINGGRINADNTAAFGTGLVTVNSGGQAFLTQSGTYGNAFTISGSGASEGVGALGAIRFSNNTVGGDVTVAAGGARVVGYTGASGTISGNLLGNGNLEINIAGNSSADGTINLAGSGAGYGGTVTVSGGRFNMGSALGGSVIVADGATLGDEGSIAGNLTLGSTSGATLAINPASSGRVSAAGDLVLNGVTSLLFTQPFGPPGAIPVASYGGTLTDGNGGTLSDSFSVPDAANYRSVIFTANAGVIELDLGRQNVVWSGNTSSVWETIGTSTNWTSTDNLFYNLDAVTFDDTATNKAVIVTGTVSPNSTVFDNSSGNDYAVSGGAIGGLGGLIKTNTGNVTFTTNNTFTGAVSIQGGSVTVGDGGTAGTLGGAGDITVAAGASLLHDRSDAVTIGRRVVGGGTLIQDGAGSLRIGQAGNNVDITVNAGTFQALDGGWATSYFATANREITINGGGTLVTSTHTLGGLGGGYNRPNMTINAGGTWQLNGEQYFSGSDLTLNGGTINVGSNDLRLEGGTVVAGASTNGSVISGNAVTLYGNTTFQVADGAAANDLGISTPINQSGTRGITKTGAGTLTLSATSTYTGNTSVENGRLNVNGSITSAAIVAANGLLGGDGTITGAVDLSGTLLPGQGGTTDRTLTINGNITTNAGSTLSFTVTSMASHDQLVIGTGSSIGLSNADLDVTFDPLLTFEILGAGQGGDFLAALDSYSGTGSWFKLISGTTTGMFNNVTDTLNASELSYFGLSGTQYKTNINGQDFWVAQGSTYLVAIPEPRAALLGGIGVLLLLRRRR